MNSFIQSVSCVWTLFTTAGFGGPKRSFSSDSLMAWCIVGVLMGGIVARSSSGAAALQPLRNAFTLRRVTGQKKSLDQLALAADGHAWESFVPFTLWYKGFGVEPLRE